jgi:predicted subunit of tRNA(5-methylaminomethyl-2-thiouridylate) methyltransferase
MPRRDTVSPSRSSSYAPVVFARHPQSEVVSKQRFEQAIRALLDRNELSVESFGPPLKRRQTIVVSGKKVAAQ